MGKYTNEKTQYYINIIKAISEHEDFGKRNPVDIGIECGFAEEDILGAIEMIRTMKAEEDEKEEQPTGEQNRENYYFFLKPYIVSVDIDSWKTAIVKKIHGSIGHWQIRKNIFVWTESVITGGGIFFFANRSEKTIYWMDLDTGEQRKLLTDEDIKNILIRESDVFILAGDTANTAILWKNDGTVYKKEVKLYSNAVLLEAGDTIYAVDFNSVSKLDSELNVEKIWERGLGSEYDYTMGAIEYLNGKLRWYIYKENSHLFSNSSWSYRKYTEGENSYSTDAEGFRASTDTILDGIVTGVFTQNYRLLQKEIRSIDNKHSICTFNRDLSKESNHGQVISIPEKDIFIGVGKNNKIIKIDLRNERQVVEIPVEFPDDDEDDDEIIY